MTYAVGDRVRLTIDEWDDIPKGSEGTVVNADAWDDMIEGWKASGLDQVFGMPEKPEWTSLKVHWDNQPEDWDDDGYVADNEVELVTVS